MVEEDRCELCKRAELELTRHHLIPRARHRKGQTQRQFAAAELTGRIAMLCRACHKFIHSVLSEKQLAADYNTVEQLQAHPEIGKFVGWIATKQPGLQVRSARRR
jgi:hypothetical protein